MDLIEPAFKMQAPDLVAFRPGAEQAFWQAGLGERALAVRRASGIIAFCRIFHRDPPWLFILPLDIEGHFPLDAGGPSGIIVDDIGSSASRLLQALT